MTTWTIERVAARFEEAVQTIRRLPAVRTQGYFSVWPTIKRQRWERLCVDDVVYRFPPDASAITRLEETMAWLVCLEIEERHLIWMRAEDEPWREICGRLGCDRTTAWRRWQRALGHVATRLNRQTAGQLDN